MTATTPCLPGQLSVAPNVIVPPPRRSGKAGSVGVVLQLPDGTPLRFRPLDRGDRDTLQQVFDGLSADSRYLRFLTPTPRLSERLLQYLADVDHDRHAAWVAELDGQPVGIGRYVRDRAAPTVAEFAVEVIDAHHGRGLGRLLLNVLGAVAAANGVETFSYLFSPANVVSLAMVRPHLHSRRLVDGAIEGRGPVPGRNLPSRTELAAVAALARWASAPAVVAEHER